MSISSADLDLISLTCYQFHGGIGDTAVMASTVTSQPVGLGASSIFGGVCILSACVSPHSRATLDCQ